MKFKNSDFWFQNKVEDVKRRILNTINVYGRANIGAKISKIMQKRLLHTFFRSTIYVDGIQNSPLDILYVHMKKNGIFANSYFASFLD